MDDRGRLADRTVLNALGWAPGTPLTSRYRSGLLALRPDPLGMIRITPQGHLRLPSAVRHRCGLHGGDRVLLAADWAHDVLIVHPPAVLDDVLASRHAELLGGDPA